MKRILFFALFLCSMASHGFAQTIETRISQVITAYNCLQAHLTPETQMAFFDSFPTNWNEFIIMEYELYRSSGESVNKYVEAYRNLTAVDDTLYCGKLMNVAFAGTYDADGSSLIQRLLHGIMGDKERGDMPKKGTFPHLMLHLLSQRLKGDILRFWQFYWSELYFEEDNGLGNDYCFNEEFCRLQKIVAKDYPDMLEAMTIGYLYFHHRVLFLGDYSM